MTNPLPAATALIASTHELTTELRVQLRADSAQWLRGEIERDRALALENALRDDLAEARREARMYRELYLAALDGLVLSYQAPRVYERMQRELLDERVEFIKGELCQPTQSF